MSEVGTKLVFENDRIKVWEFTLAPGETIGAHTHKHDYFFYPLEGSTLEVTRANGRVDHVRLEPGSVYYRVRGDTHAAKSTIRTKPSYHATVPPYDARPPFASAEAARTTGGRTLKYP